MRIFLTGGSGYIGGQLARRLAADGHEVRALVRPDSDTSGLTAPGGLAAPGISTHLGDVTDRYSMREGMSGADWVIHAAAYVDIDGPPGALEEVNVGGSENVASLAYKLGVGRMLAVSSIAAFGGSPEDGTPADEGSGPLRPLPSAYSVTKRAGEERARAWAEQGLRLNVVYPSLVYGPPGKKSGTNTLIRAILRRRYKVLVAADRKTSWIHIDDLVDGLVRVMERAEPGRDYLLAGDVVPVGEVVRRVCRLGGVRPPRFHLPLVAARALAAVTAPPLRLVGRRPPMTPGQLASLGRHWAFDDSRARRELGWRPRTLEEGLPATVEYLMTVAGS